jgi:hypothetical protein
MQDEEYFSQERARGPLLFPLLLASLPLLDALTRLRTSILLKSLCGNFRMAEQLEHEVRLL